MRVARNAMFLLTFVTFVLLGTRWLGAHVHGDAQEAVTQDRLDRPAPASRNLGRPNKTDVDRVRPGTSDVTAPRIVSILPDPSRGIVDNIGLTGVVIAFDEPVMVPAEAITVWTVGAGVIGDFTTCCGGVSSVLIIGFPTPIRDDSLTLVVDYTVTDTTGNELDGEIAVPATGALPSGDGIPGGQAVFRINILQGDANRDGVVDDADGTVVSDSLGRCVGDASFDPDADLNNDGCVNVLDTGIFALAVGRSLPQTDGTAPNVIGITPDPAGGLSADLLAMTLTFDEPLDASRFIEGTCFLVDRACIPHRPSLATLAADGLSAVYEFTPALPQCDTYSINVSNALADLSGSLLVPSVPSSLITGPTSLGCPVFDLSLTSPADGLVTQDGVVDIVGTVTDDVSVFVNGVEATVDNGFFTVFDVPLSEGTNTLVATAQSCHGEVASDAVIVRRDTAPPLVAIETPAEGDRLVTGLVTVAGTVNDIIPGTTVNDDDVSVTVNGLVAAVNNRTFIVPDVPLFLGPNTLTAVVVDAAGNSNEMSIEVTLEPDLAGIQIVITGGNAQVGSIGGLLPVPLSVRLEDAGGLPFADRPLTFEVSRGDGLLDDTADDLRTITFLADGAGNAALNFTLGSRTGAGFHRVRVTTPGSLTFAEFCATAEPTGAVNIAINGMPPGQSVVGQALTERLSAIVTDEGGNPVPDVDVTFDVVFGGGNFGGAQSVVSISNADGVAEAVWTLGPDEGVGNNEATATFPGNAGFVATYVVSGIVPGPGEDTTVSGIVQDSTGNPIVGVRAVIRGTELEAFTGPDGKFTITDVPPGGHRIGVLGSAANDPENGISFPDIDFAIEAVSGVDNMLDPPVVGLPFLDTVNEKLVGGDEDVTLIMEGVSGSTVKVFAHSTFRRDPDTGELVQESLVMSSSQVKFNKMPMPPPQGSTPVAIGTLQPSGVIFFPPARVTYPNVAGLAPGDVADMFAFHHDIGQFVNIGPGTVSEDGSVVVSDPGFGIVQSGWHCLVRLPGPAAKCANGCKASATWTITKNGTGSGTIAPGPDAKPVLMAAVDDPDKRQEARIEVAFSPSGSIEGQWTIQGSTIAEIIGQTGFVVQVKALAPGTATLTSPNAVSPDGAGGPNIVCQAVIEVKVIKVDLIIHNGLKGVSGGQKIDEADEETVGAVTVANLNDTDGDGTDGTLDKDDDDVSVTGANPPGRNEHDLMELIIKKPVPDCGDKVTLEVVSGDVKLWEKSTKETEIELAGGKVEFDTSDLDKTIWVEASALSGSLRDIELELEYKGLKDKVKATGLWVAKTRTFSTRAAAGANNTVPANLDRVFLSDDITMNAVAVDGSHYGVGPFERRTVNQVLVDTLTGGRILFEFEIKPHGVEDLGVIFDLTRQLEARDKEIVSGSGTLAVATGLPDLDFPEDETPKKDNETPNDDGTTSDEDNAHKNHFIYTFDSPGSSVSAGNMAFLIKRDHFREWVRIRLSGAFANINGTVEGSRASDKEDWHLLNYLKRGADGKWTNDGTATANSAPIRAGTGNGSMAVTLLADAVTEGFAATYEAANKKWTLLGTSGDTANATQAAVPAGTVWSITIGTKVKVDITQEATAFDNGDTFTFSVFKTSATGGKVNEIAVGSINITTGP